MAIDHYAMERLILERHQETIRRAEQRSRLVFTAGLPPAGQLVAGWLRRLADRLDGGANVELPSFSATSSS